jgi:excisionase family DNA binding protein
MAATAAPGRRYASVRKAAEAFDVNPRTIHKWICDGLISSYRVGHRLIKVDLDEVERRAVRPIPTGEARP